MIGGSEWRRMQIKRGWINSLIAIRSSDRRSDHPLPDYPRTTCCCRSSGPATPVVESRVRASASSEDTFVELPVCLSFPFSLWKNDSTSEGNGHCDPACRGDDWRGCYARYTWVNLYKRSFQRRKYTARRGNLLYVFMRLDMMLIFFRVRFLCQL